MPGPFVKIEIPTFPFDFTPLEIVWFAAEIFFARGKWLAEIIIDNHAVGVNARDIEIPDHSVRAVLQSE